MQILLRVEKDRQPASIATALQVDFYDHGQRHREEHADRPEHPAPEDQGEENDETGKPQSASHKLWLDEVADDHVDYQVTSCRCDRRRETELYQSQQDSWNSGYD